MTQAFPAIAIHNVTCVFGKRRALDALSLQVDAGRVVGVVGPNGAGKTTLVDVVCGLLRPNSGDVSVLGIDVAREPRNVRGRIGVVPQETALYEDVSVLDNLRFSAALYGVADPEARIARLLDVVGLSARARDRAAVLSGGMKRRLCIARALLHQPSLLVLDEPTVGVDVEARHQIWDHIRTLRRAGCTVLLSTNYLDEAEALCDRVAMLREGRLVEENTPAALLAAAGRCLDIDCADEQAEAIAKRLVAHPHVLRTELSKSGGLTVYIGGAADVDGLVREAMSVGVLHGFRARSPDLAEVFGALGRTSPK
jgi:ABC-2 type transport system ATP-binding protein